MSTSVIDKGAEYLVKVGRLEEAFKHLESEGEYAECRTNGDGTVTLFPKEWDDMFCGNVAYSFYEEVEQFMEVFCEAGSQASFFDDEQLEWTLVWKDAEGAHHVQGGLVNPFEERIEEIRSMR